MKKQKLIIIMMSLLWMGSLVNAQAPNYLWAKSGPGAGSDPGRSIAVDINGNSYVTGSFGGAITFGSITLTTTGLYDMYIVKYDQSGNVIWATSDGGTGYDYGISIAVDASGNTYVTGSFDSPSITFGSTTLTNPNIYDDMFIVKYDASGNVVWANSGSGTSRDYGLGIGVDANGNSYVTGYFIGTSITFGSITLTNVGNPAFFRDEMFIVKYDSSGNVAWAKSGAGTSFDEGTAIAVDASGNSYVTGWFGSPGINFGGTFLSTTSGYNIFLVKYDTGGSVVWAKSAGGNSTDHGYGIAIDGIGNSFVTGTFLSDSIIFGNSTLTNSGFDDMFVMKFDVSGNPVWAKSAGGTYYDKGKGIATDASGNCYVAGYYGSPSITFGSTTLTTSLGNNQMFLVKYNPSGSVSWVKSATGNTLNVDVEIAVAADAGGHSFVAGGFAGYTMIFGSTTLTGTSTSYYDVFIAKVDSAPGASIPVAAFTANITNIAVGGSVNFTDLSTNSPTSWNWTFNGGSPANSTMQNPTNIIYNTAGCYAVTLVATNTAGSGPLTQTCYINVGIVPAVCNELFFSEHIEGSSNNKALEIYNPTASAINISNYAIELYNNGSATVSSTYTLSGTIASHDVFVIANPASSAAILAQADVTNTICQFNGNDAIALTKNGNILDLIGEVGVNPGNSWPVGSGSTMDYTLVRNYNVDGPSSNWATVQNQWTANAVNTTTDLGQHTSICNSTISIQNYSQLQNSVSVYPNPTSGQFTILLPTGNTKIIVTNAVGQQIIKTQSTQKSINLKLEENGVYFLYVTTKQGTTTQKLIVTH
jgi:PKD repeat protein